MAVYGASATVPDAGGPVAVTVWRDHEPLARRDFTVGDLEVGNVTDWVSWVVETDSGVAMDYRV